MPLLSHIRRRVVAEEDQSPAGANEGDSRPGNDHPFLANDDEIRRFNARYSRYPRILREVGDADRRAGKRNQTHGRTIKSTVELALLKLKNRGGGRLAYIVGVQEHDGRSWSATAAYQTARQSPAAMPCVILTRSEDPNGLPAVERLLGRRNVLRLAQQTGVTASFRILQPAFTVLVVAAGLVVAAAISVVTAVLSASAKNKTTAGDIVGLRFVILALVLGALALLGRELALRYGTDNREKAREKLRNDLSEARAKSTAAHRKWISAMARALEDTQSPRSVVAEIESLDPETRGVIEEYLKRAVPRERKRELWILFETHPGTLRRAIESDFVDIGRAGPTFFEQELLSADQRLELATEIAHPERATFRTVGAICEPDPSAHSTLRRLFDEYRRAHPADSKRYGTLEFLYLLSLTSHDVPLGRSYLQKNLRTQQIRSQPLLAALPGATLSPSELYGHIQNIVHEFALALDERHASENGFEIIPEAANVLVANRIEYGLPDPRIGHLFWALFWFDKLRNDAAVEPFYVRKLLGHLSSTTAPALLFERDSSELTTYLGEAAAFAAAEALKASILEPIPDVLNFAESLLAEGGTRGQRRALRRLCWTANALLGDDRIILVILQLHPLATGGGRPEQPNSMDRLFAELLQGGDPSADARANLANALTEDHALRGYAWARGYWLARLLLGTRAAQAPTSIAAAGEGLSHLPEFIVAALDRLLEAPTGEQLASDVMTVSLGLWALSYASIPKPGEDALSSLVQSIKAQGFIGEITKYLQEAVETRGAADVGTVVPLLSHAWLVSEYLEEAARSATAGAGYNFPLRGLVQELRVIIAACAKLLKGAEAHFSPEVRAELSELERVVGESLSSPRADSRGANDTDSIKRAMGLLELTWEHLGFEELASLMALRRAEFTASAESGDRTRAAIGQVINSLPPELGPKFAAFVHAEHKAHDTLEEALSSMPQELSQPGWRGLAAGCIAARVLAGRDENAAQVFVRGVRLALDAKVGDSLGSELALMAVSFGHSYRSVDLTKVLEHLVDSPGDVPYSTNLARALETLDDDEFDSNILPLLNAVRARPLERFVDRIQSAIRDRAKTVREDLRANVDDNLELFELRRQLELEIPIDRESVIDRWRERGSWDNYAYILFLLGFGENVNPAIAGQAQRLLQDHPLDSPSSAPLLLAVKLAQDAQRRERAKPGDAAAGEQLAAAVQYLQGVIDRWEGSLSIDSTIDAYQILVTHANGDRGKYVESLIRWDAFLQEREGLTRLPVLITQGQHFLVVWHYFATLNFWGLKAEPECTPAEINSMGAGEIARRTHELASDRRISEPIATVNHRVRLAAEFLRDGHAAYRAEGESGAVDARARVDKVAAARLPALFKAMATLDSIPDPLRDMLQRHEHSLLRQKSTT